jgi:hypothetical protein
MHRRPVHSDPWHALELRRHLDQERVRVVLRPPMDPAELVGGVTHDVSYGRSLRKFRGVAAVGQ